MSGSRPRLPPAITACLFDLDGVLTDTATLHAEAWKQMFDAFLRGRAAATGERLVPLRLPHDYLRFIDGKPRFDGVRAFLEARGIALAEGTHDDPPGAETVGGLANRKNELVLRLMHERGVNPFPGSVRFVEAVRAAGLARAVVSASANCHDVLVAAGIVGLFDAEVDGTVVEHEHLRGKPAPDAYLEAARVIGVEPANAAVFEDALAGVAAGRAGGFGLVVGVHRHGHAEELTAQGADVVVSDLAELLD